MHSEPQQHCFSREDESGEEAFGECGKNGLMTQALDFVGRQGLAKCIGLCLVRARIDEMKRIRV